MTPSFQIERAIFHWPAVVSSAPDGWAKDFARSIATQSRRPRWSPTPKQAEIMNRMVNELFTHPDEQEEDFTVIE
ncbi:MAG: hypothetical protein CML66_14735 [Rhodobacteraceae bacterium]|nr:hypothetical protein [Paracoccaceae bacterium]MAY47172.1 hypothetical protein [Paracoccaceae bacterium]